ncbi:MAG: serine hydrolase [Flavobacteriaceae bacterium]|nr:serine hydrolase [Flavobacteriaceae bacterium]
MSSSTLASHVLMLGILWGMTNCQSNQSKSQDQISDEPLDQQLNEVFIDQDLLGLSVVLIEKGQLSYQKHFGTIHPDSDENLNGSTKFRIASISKIIPSLAIMQLVERDLVHLDEDVSVYLGWKLRNPNHPHTPITLRQLMSHTSSIRDGEKYSNFAAHMTEKKLHLSALFQGDGQYYTESMFDRRKPGTYFTYTNCTWGLVASVIEKVANQRFDVYTQEHIFQPLNITASFNFSEIHDTYPLAGLYRYQDNQWVNQIDDYRKNSPIPRVFEGYELGQNGLLFGPQGNLRASTEDLVGLTQLFLNQGTVNGNQIISKASLDQMLQIQWSYDGSNGDTWDEFFNAYGLGIHVLTNQPGKDIVFPGFNMVGHPGIAYGLLSDLYFDIESQTGIVFITNGKKQAFEYGNNSTFYSVEEDVFETVYPYLKKSQ